MFSILIWLFCCCCWATAAAAAAVAAVKFALKKFTLEGSCWILAGALTLKLDTDVNLDGEFRWFDSILEELFIFKYGWCVCRFIVDWLVEEAFWKKLKFWEISEFLLLLVRVFCGVEKGEFSLLFVSNGVFLLKVDWSLFEFESLILEIKLFLKQIIRKTL